MAGEWIVDQVVLTIAPDAAPGEYSLSTGLYRPADGERLPLFDEAGQPVINNEVILGMLHLSN